MTPRDWERLAELVGMSNDACFDKDGNAVRYSLSDLLRAEAKRVREERDPMMNALAPEQTEPTSEQAVAAIVKRLRTFYEDGDRCAEYVLKNWRRMCAEDVEK